MPSGRTPRSGCMGLNMVTGANINGHSTHPSSDLHMDKSMENEARTITSRWYAGPWGGNRCIGMQRC